MDILGETITTILDGDRNFEHEQKERDLKNKIQKLTEQNETFKKQVADRDSDITGITLQCLRLKNQIEDLREEHEEQVEKNKEHEATIRSEKIKLQKILKEKNDLQAKIDSYQHHTHSMDRAPEFSISAYNSDQPSIRPIRVKKPLNVEADTGEKHQVALSLKLQKVTTDLEEYRHKYSKLLAEHQHIRELFVRVQRDLDMERANTKKVKELQSEKEAWIRWHEEDTQEFRRLEDALGQEIDKTQSLKKQLDQKTKQCAQLTQRLSGATKSIIIRPDTPKDQLLYQLFQTLKTHFDSKEFEDLKKDIQRKLQIQQNFQKKIGYLQGHIEKLTLKNRQKGKAGSAGNDILQQFYEKLKLHIDSGEYNEIRKVIEEKVRHDQKQIAKLKVQLANTTQVLNNVFLSNDKMSEPQMSKQLMKERQRLRQQLDHAQAIKVIWENKGEFIRQYVEYLNNNLKSNKQQEASFIRKKYIQGELKDLAEKIQNEMERYK